MNPHVKLQRVSVVAVVSTSLASGLAALFAPAVRRLPLRLNTLAYQFHPIVIHRLLSIFLGFALIYISYQLAERRQVAWWVAFVSSAYLAVSTTFYHALPAVALLAAVNLLCLVICRQQFTARSEISSMRRGVILLGISVVLAVGYGVVGFWLLDRRDFGQEFNLGQATVRTVQQYTLVGNGDLVPHTRYARGFLDSLDFIGVLGLGFGLYSLFRPLSYSLRTLPHEREAIHRLLVRYGDLSEGFLKLWPADKSYFFLPGEAAGVAYRVTTGVAISVGAPVGSPASRQRCIQAFTQYCRNNSWDPVFVLVPERGRELFGQGWRPITIGEDAIIKLDHFSGQVAGNKHFRNIHNRFERLGCQFSLHQPPHASPLLAELALVDRTWQDSGKKQWGFLQGAFTPAYLQTGPLYVVRDQGGRVIAFANGTTDYVPGQATIDMMRHLPDAPNNTMDFLLMEILLAASTAGLTSFNLGLAPFSVSEAAGAGDRSPEDRVIQVGAARLNQGFISVDGLRRFKQKFEPEWEAQYLMYRGLPTSLPKIAVAFARATQR